MSGTVSGFALAHLHERSVSKSPNKPKYGQLVSDYSDVFRQAAEIVMLGPGFLDGEYLAGPQSSIQVKIVCEVLAVIHL